MRGTEAESGRIINHKSSYKVGPGDFYLVKLTMTSLYGFIKVDICVIVVFKLLINDARDLFDVMN